MDALRAVPDKSLAGIVITLLGIFAVRGEAQWVVLLLGIGLIVYGYVARSHQQRQEMLDLLRKQQEQERPPAP